MVMKCALPTTKSWDTNVTYGTPNPRYVRPLVRVNSMVEDMPQGYKLDPCLLPDTVVRIDNCNKTLTVNSTMVSYADMFDCMKLGAGAGAPVNAPSEGYYPFYFDVQAKKLHVYVNGTWNPA